MIMTAPYRLRDRVHLHLRDRDRDLHWVVVVSALGVPLR
jgi:hypothetical protein